jgi:hypothetical protein
MFLPFTAIAPPAIAQEVDDCDADHAGAPAEWVAAQDGTFELVFDTDPDMSVEIEAEAAISELTYDWIQGPYQSESGHFAIRMEPPAGAFLDDIALDYATVLRVRVVASRDDHPALSFGAMPAFLAWPLGPENAPVVWDRATQQQEAPNGVLNDTIRASITLFSSDAWVQAPRRHAAVKPE